MSHGLKGSKLTGIGRLEEEENEELWLVSYADMVTLLFGFFVILFSFSTIDDKKFDQMTEKVAEAFKSTDEKKKPDESAGVAGEDRQIRAMQMMIQMLNLGENTEAAIAKIEKTFNEQKTVEAAKAVLMEKVAVDNKDLVSQTGQGKDEKFHLVEMVIPDSALFESESYQISPGATPKLRRLASDFLQVPDLIQVEVVAHTDSKPPKPGLVYTNNLTYSAMRAGSVAEVLISSGVESKKVIVKGMGNLQPLLPEKDDKGRLLVDNMKKNRRITLVLKLKEQVDAVSH